MIKLVSTRIKKKQKERKINVLTLQHNYYKCLLVRSYSITVIGQRNKLLYQFIPESLYSISQKRRNRPNIAEKV